MNPTNFKFTSENIMLDFNWVIIASDNKQELLFMFGLLNSVLIWTLLNCLLRLQNEKSFSIGIKTVKGFVRIPIISPTNQHLKDAVITLADSILKLDKQTIGDLVEFDTLVQRFDDVWTEGSALVLRKGPKEIRAAIKRGAAKVVEGSIDRRLGSQKLLPGEREITLAELKALPAFDKEEQDKIKEQIDELVFNLYGLTKDERALIRSAALTA